MNRPSPADYEAARRFMATLPADVCRDYRHPGEALQFFAVGEMLKRQAREFRERAEAVRNSGRKAA